MIRPLKRYFEVSGRSSRSEYWMFILFQGLVSSALLALWVGLVVASPPGSMMIPSIMLGLAYGLFLLGSIIPNVTVLIRRLHDTNRSAWWLLLYAPGFISAAQTVWLVARAVTATPAEMSELVSQSLSSTALGLATLVCQSTLFVYLVLAGTKGSNRFGEDPLSTQGSSDRPAAEVLTESPNEPEPIAPRMSLSNLPLQPVRSNPRPSPAPFIVDYDARAYDPGVRPAQPFGRRSLR